VNEFGIALEHFRRCDFAVIVLGPDAARVAERRNALSAERPAPVKTTIFRYRIMLSLLMLAQRLGQVA